MRGSPRCEGLYQTDVLMFTTERGRLSGVVVVVVMVSMGFYTLKYAVYTQTFRVIEFACSDILVYPFFGDIQ